MKQKLIDALEKLADSDDKVHLWDIEQLINEHIVDTTAEQLEESYKRITGSLLDGWFKETFRQMAKELGLEQQW